MLTKTFLFFFLILIIQSCNFSTSTFERNQSIDAQIRKEIKILNDKLFQGITRNNLASVQSLLSPGLLNKAGNNQRKLINLITSKDIKNYSILDEFYIQASDTRINITVRSGNSGNNDYVFTFKSPNTESYVSLILLDNIGNQFLLAAVYGKYHDDWKLNILKFSQYSFFGNTAFDYFRKAKESYSKTYLIDAINNITLSNVLLYPATPYFHFIKEKEIQEYGKYLLQAANVQYQFPMTLSTIKSKPRVFRIFPQVIEEGFFPMVYYHTNINLKDTLSLKLENLQIRKKVGSIFKGIDKGKKFVYYWAFNEMPDGKKAVAHYGFIDSLIKK